ncbi:histone deacetylase 1/2 [Angomonas deanei]|nr:histone deacetylase 1/2 [Angomonas deanei]|eukprot:EPY27099.1 histone deacetylase 1/2 [Angomonas deanei]
MSASPPVGLFFGSNVDDSATPPSSERNRLVTDLVLHYACKPFLKKGHQEEGTLHFWNTSKCAPQSDVFYWYNAKFPTVGVEECIPFHDESYIKFLRIRETLSEVDERVQETMGSGAEEVTTSAVISPSNIKRMRVESSRPPSYARRSCPGEPLLTSPTHHTEPPPIRPLPDLIPIPLDEDYQLTKDAFPFLGLWRSVSSTLSGTLTALRWLLGEGEEQTEPTKRLAAVHWFGGRHHAKSGSGGGFCYVNDVVLAALHWRSVLRQRQEKRSKLLIVDLDAHHGDGTETAFLFDPSVYTLSVHAFEVGVYPHTGEATQTGKGLGKHCNLNLPLPVGTTDAVYVPLARRAIRTAVDHIGPQELGGVLLVCGADGLKGDPLGNLNLSVGGLQSVSRLVMDVCAELHCPLLLLGAGGYVDTSTAKLAAVVTRDLLSYAANVGDSTARYSQSPWLVESGVQVPDECYYFTRYGPSFLMHVTPAARCELVNSLSPSHPYYESWHQLQEKLVKASKKEEDGSSP